jgi:exonuclease SbcC
MLPQGAFAAFLRSKASDRLELLQKLFGTERFEAVERELAVKAADAAKEVAGHNGKLALIVARADAEAAAMDLDMTGAPDAGRAGDRLAWLESAASAKASALAAEAESCEALHRECTARRDQELAREGRRLKLAAALRRKADAAAAGSALEDTAARLSQHRKAEILGGHLKAVAAADALVTRAAEAVERAAAGVERAASEQAELAGTDSSAVDVTAELGRLRSLLAVVNERLADEDRLAGLWSRSAGLAGEHQRLSDAIQAHATSLLSLRSEMAGLQAGLEPLELLAGESVLRTKEAAAADELVDVVRRYGAAAVHCAAATERHLRGREEHQELRTQWLDVREERLSNAAAELAARLEHGEPCPVCGSAEHPAPVPTAESALGLAEKEEQAKAQFERAEKALAALDAELSAARQLVAVLAGQGGDTDPAEARKAAQTAAEAAAEAAAAEIELATSRARQAQLADRIDSTERARVEAMSGLAQTESTMAEVEHQAATLESALAALRAGYGSLGLRCGGIGATIDVLERASSARAELDQAAARLADAQGQLDGALPEAGFGSAADAQAALLTPPESARLDAAVRAGHDELARLEELFASEELILAGKERESGNATEPGELERLRADADQAEKTAKDVALAAGLALQSSGSLGRLRRDYEDLAEAGRGPQERAELLTALADSSRGAGDNSYRMSLNSYVCAARLEQVAIAASERLVAMSDGRYTLQHTDARAARNAKSGLGLEVVDEWTGQRRDTSTLSGGESFMASLSLALGLADVVQQEAGGVDIETLFVDEGFGSLDEQALEQVMDALEGLRDGGRVVGLVSHVAEMKQRIGTQLQVVKGRNGSTLHVSDTAAAA